MRSVPGLRGADSAPAWLSGPGFPGKDEYSIAAGAKIGYNEGGNFFTEIRWKAMILSAENIVKSFGEKIILAGVSLKVEDSDRIGLVGVNGSGKTTLLRILAGLDTADSGSLAVASGKSVGFLRQDTGLSPHNTIMQEMELVFEDLRELEQRIRRLEQQLAAVDGAEYDKTAEEISRLTNRFESRDGYQTGVKIRTVLSGMGFAGRADDTVIDTLSGGERTRLALAKLLLEEPDLLILDEPTNHLDFRTLDWLEEYLLTYRGALLVVSHDRYFLDKIVTSMCELEWHKLDRFKGNYTKFVALKAEKLERRQKEYQTQMETIAKLQDYADRNIARASSSSSAKSRLAAIARMEPAEKPVPPPKPPWFRFEYDQEPVRDVLHAESLTLTVGEPPLTLMSGVDLDLLRGDKVAIVGTNGVGKTTLLRVLQARENPRAIRWGRNVRIGYYDQQMSTLHPELTARDELWNRHPRLPELEIRSMLGRVGLTGDNVFKKVGILSGGERAKLVLAILMMERANVLLLDEPTNHLDVAAKEALDAALMQFTGTILMISHDRYMLNKVPDRIIEMTGRAMEIHEGRYDSYAERRVRPEKKSAPVQVHATDRFLLERDKTDDLTLPPKPQRPAYKSRKERAEAQKRRSEIRRIEEESAFLERTLKLLEEELSQPEVSSDYERVAENCAEMERLRTEIAGLESRWLELNEESPE